MKHTPFNPVSSVLLVLKKGLHNSFGMIIFFANRACRCWAIAQCEARPQFCFVFFFSVKCHIQQLEKAVSILNIKKMKNATNILFSLTTLPEKK